jgi:FkbM family methyltransferase
LSDQDLGACANSFAPWKNFAGVVVLYNFKKSIATFARKCGYEIIPSYQLPDMPLALHLQDLFARLGIDLVVDVGAHYGEYCRFLRDLVGYTGWILSVEPIAENFEILKRTHESDSRWVGVNAALGPENATMAINVTKDTRFASFKAPDRAGLLATGNAQMLANAAVERTEIVQMQRLDALLSRHYANRPMAKVYLKLDTQGYDLHVLSGIGESRSVISALQSEISVMPLYEGMPNYAESIEAFNSLGFDVTGFFPVSRDEKLRVIEFDCTAISRTA